MIELTRNQEQKGSWKAQNPGRLNNTFLNKAQVKEEIQEKVENILN
jgi:hypothetical protein